MTHMTAPPSGAGYRIATTVSAVIILMGILALLCFCSMFPATLFLSFVFNALVLGSSLFATLAQEREKRTIDALRLTQLSSLDILRLKSHRELRTWFRGNLVLTGSMLLAGLQAGVPAIWALSGALALAAGGLLSIGMALAVSTRSETTSSAVVSGWVCKGAWLVGLPLLDQVLEAVFVTNSSVHLLRYLDPAWVALKVSEVAFFEMSSLTLVSLWMGALATVAVAGFAVWQSSLLIDTSFESAATLEDRTRHRAYGREYPLGLHENPFFVRELVWQMRSGAGSWPGYAVFLTLFLAPFLYGMAQSQKVQNIEAQKIVRQGVLQTVEEQPVVEPNYFDSSQTSPSSQGYTVSGATVRSAPVQECHRAHSGLCMSKMMRLPVDEVIHVESGSRHVVSATGAVHQVSKTVLESSENHSADSSSSSNSYTTRQNSWESSSPSLLQYELGRGLLTGLLLTVIYLFVRGGAFLASSVTGEKERRAWDQIALTGMTPDSYIAGKLAAVLAFPIRQMLMASPALILFVLHGILTPMQMVLTVAMLITSFAAAGALGVAASASSVTSHQAQGAALGIAAALLILPIAPGGGGLLVLAGSLLLLRARLSSQWNLLAFVGLLVIGSVGGAMVSPLAAVLALCGTSAGSSSIVWAVGGVSGGLLWSTLSMAFFGGLFYRAAVSSLEHGGSVRA